MSVCLHRDLNRSFSHLKLCDTLGSWLTALPPYSLMERSINRQQWTVTEIARGWWWWQVLDATARLKSTHKTLVQRVCGLYFDLCTCVSVQHPAVISLRMCVLPRCVFINQRELARLLVMPSNFWKHVTLLKLIGEGFKTQQVWEEVTGVCCCRTAVMTNALEHILSLGRSATCTAVLYFPVSVH